MRKLMALGAMLAMMVVAASPAMAQDRDGRGDRVENRIENRIDRFEDRHDVDFYDDFDGFEDGGYLISSGGDFDEIALDGDEIDFDWDEAELDDLDYFVVYEYDDGEVEVEDVFFA